MKLLHDVKGLAIRLTDERRAHILEHPEMASMESAIEETLLHPERVVQSFSDRTIVGGKFLCVVVKTLDADAFVLTAYLTDRVKKGVPLWPTNGKE